MKCRIYEKQYFIEGMGVSYPAPFKFCADFECHGPPATTWDDNLRTLTQ